MPNTEAGRNKILQFLKSSNISQATLSVVYGIAKQDISDYLNGKLVNTQANRFIARVIEDFRIR